MTDLTYKCHTLTINELPNFKNPEDKLYRGTTFIDGKKWEKDGSAVYLIESWFRNKIDNLYRGMTFEQVYKEWGSNWKKLIYKDRPIYLDIKKKAKDNKVVYLGGYYTKDGKYDGIYKTIESIHYDKVVSKFEKFVDEYCTDWLPFNPTNYKGYTLWISQEYGQENFFGTCEIHKNSTFKCISKSYREIKDNFIARVDRVVEEKEKVKMNSVSSRQEKIQELEQVITRLSSQLEELKKEKDILTYKGITLELIPEKDSWFSGIIKNAPKNTCSFYNDDISAIRQDFQRYIDELEESAKLYCQLTGKELNIDRSW